MADDKVLEDEKTEQASSSEPTAEAEPEMQADDTAGETEPTTKDNDQADPTDDDNTYENVTAPASSEDAKDKTEEAVTDDNKTEGATADVTDEPLDENAAAAQPLTTDVESGQQNGEANKDKADPRIHERIFRMLKKREILFPVIGGVTFLLGLILIITGLLVMQGKCDRQAGWAGNGDSHHTDPVVASSPNGVPDNSHVTYMHSHDHNETDEDEGSVNLAEGRRAFQSTTNYLGRTIYNVSLSVDGNTTARFLKGECAQTEHQARPSWRVDLGEDNVVSRVKIIIPSDCCVGELHDFMVRVGPSEDVQTNAVCKHFMGTALKPVINMICDMPVRGRYVSIHMLGDDARPRDRLTLCEVLVYSR